jgi:hypothetical protein
LPVVPGFCGHILGELASLLRACRLLKALLWLGVGAAAVAVAAAAGVEIKKKRDRQASK